MVVVGQQHEYLRGVPELRRSVQHGAGGRERRSLQGGGGQSYMVDKYGVQYDGNSLFWRYLGLYTDCDGLSNGDFCPRKLLWAAYVDSQYQGNSIEEYQFYDLSTGEWDGSICSGRWRARCARMDCHESGTDFELVGVFKESEGMFDWTEQLFKHEGMCIWNDDSTYQTMKTWMNKWPTTCKQLDVTDSRGKTAYIAVKPISDGDMTVAIYADSACTKESSHMDLTDYIVKLYQSQGNSKSDGYQAAATYKAAIQTWNDNMNYFKICQPCMAYNLNEQNQNDHRARVLRVLEGNDYQGGQKREKYNCYDDAGYTNVNQCYKFESKTKVEAASTEDLKTASHQGSILQIEVDRKVYGRGGIKSPGGGKALVRSLGITLVVGLVFMALHVRVFVVERKRKMMTRIAGRRKKSKRRTKRGKLSSKREKLVEEDGANYNDRPNTSWKGVKLGEKAGTSKGVKYPDTDIT